MCKLKKRLPALLTVFLIVLCLVVPAIPAQAADTAIIEAGTYRFNDVLTGRLPVVDPVWPNIPAYVYVPFQVDYLGIVYDGIGFYLVPSENNVVRMDYLLSDETAALLGTDNLTVYVDNAWYDLFDESIKTVILPVDSEASADFNEWFTANTVHVNALNSTDGVLDVFSGVGSWLVSGVNSLISMFYVDGSLSFVGYLAVAGLAISVILLIFWLISVWLKFK